ncbi:MAG: polysaccharide biosynthesis protein [Chloroflexi bacterium]|nr:polysaccharide biosynthesis protein [Chloroflexota bacterium]
MITVTDQGLARRLNEAFSLRHRMLRRLVLASADAPLVAAAGMAAALLALPADGPRAAWPALPVFAALGLATKLPVMGFFGVYSVDWRHVEVREMMLVGRALVIGSLILAALIALLARAAGIEAVPPLVLLLDFLLAFLFVTGSRVAAQTLRERRRTKLTRPRLRVLIVGAGDAGGQIVRAIHEDGVSEYQPVGFVDDDPGKVGLKVHGIPIFGTRHALADVASRVPADELWVAMPSAPGQAVQETVELGRAAGFKQIKVLPGLTALLTGRVKLGDLREVQVEELLGRDPVRIDTTRVNELLRGRCVLVTGGAGSIGSELCRQIARLSPEMLLVFDQDETGVFNVVQSLLSELPVQKVDAVIGDVKDAAKVDQVFRKYRPAVVFHAAAYKHVPLMETHPDQAIKTNVFGTRVVAEAAQRWAASRFVLISTDKAVNPTSILGATKRAAEVLLQQLERTGKTSFISVRFGNVLGSRGSVVPIFREQIARGGPVTVTDPEMKRYFMTIPEAVLLVLQAAAMGEDGQVTVLDMGKPVRIVDLARQLIRIAGLEPDRDIPIVYTGIRPGEKLFEDILDAEEGTTATCHDRVYVARVNGQLTQREFEERIAALENTVANGSREQIVAALRRIVSSYKPPEVVEVPRDATRGADAAAPLSLPSPTRGEEERQQDSRLPKIGEPLDAETV